MSDGGWEPCQKTIIGKVLGVYSTTEPLNFMEVMAYSEEAIQLGAGVVVSIKGTPDIDKPLNRVIQKNVSLIAKSSDYTRTLSCFKITPVGGQVELSVKFKA